MAEITITKEIHAEHNSEKCSAWRLEINDLRWLAKCPKRSARGISQRA